MATIMDLPDEILLQIFLFCPVLDTIAWKRVCQKWYMILSDPHYWWTVCNNLGIPVNTDPIVSFIRYFQGTFQWDESLSAPTMLLSGDRHSCLCVSDGWALAVAEYKLPRYRWQIRVQRCWAPIRIGVVFGQAPWRGDGPLERIFEFAGVNEIGKCIATYGRTKQTAYLRVEEGDVYGFEIQPDDQRMYIYRNGQLYGEISWLPDSVRVFWPVVQRACVTLQPMMKPTHSTT